MVLGGKRTCKYYKACGNTWNCSRCLGFEKADKKSNNKEVKANDGRKNTRS